MDNAQIYAALSAIVRLARLNLQQQAATMGATQFISCAALLPAWQPGPYTTGQAVNHNGQPWRCLQDHDSTGNDTWSPGAAPSLWGAYHSTTAKWALPWVAPTGAHDAYQAGEYMIWTDGQTYRCTTDNTVHSPDVLPQSWECQQNGDE